MSSVMHLAYDSGSLNAATRGCCQPLNELCAQIARGVRSIAMLTSSVGSFMVYTNRMAFCLNEKGKNKTMLKGNSFMFILYLWLFFQKL